MKSLQTIHLVLLALCCFTQSVVAQNRFNSCSAAFLDKKMVVDEYTTSGKCKINIDAKGELTVCTAELSPEKSIPQDEISFMVAICDGSTKTMMMFSKEVYRRVPMEKVLAKCQKGDSIVLLIMEDDFALPHNEILVE